MSGQFIVHKMSPRRDLRLRSAKSLVSLLSDGELHTLALGQRDVGLVSLANDEDVADPGGEGVAAGVLDVDDVEGAGVSLPGHDGSHTASVSPASHHAQVAGVEGDRVLDLPRGDVHLHGVINLNSIFNYIMLENISHFRLL